MNAANSVGATEVCHNHRGRKHGILPSSKYLVDGHTCIFCLKRLPTIIQLYQHLESDSRQCLAAWGMLDLRLSSEQVEATERLRKREVEQLRCMGYRGTKSPSPAVRVHRPLCNLPCIDFNLSVPDIPTAKVFNDPLSYGQHSHVQNLVAVDASELPSAAYFSPAKNDCP